MDFLSVFVVFSAFILGIATSACFIWLSKRYALSILRKEANARGNVKQEAQANRLMDFIGEATDIVKRAKDEGKDMKEVLKSEAPALLIRYPDVVAKYGQQIFKKFKDLEGLGL